MKINSYINYFLGVLFACTAAAFSAEAQPMFFTSGGNSSNTFPLGSTTNRVQWLYMPTDFNALPNAGNITKIYFKPSTAAATVTFTDYTVKMTSTSATATSATTWFPTTTQYYNASQTFTGVVINNWVVVTLQTPFYWNGTSNLIFEMSQSAYTGSGLYMNQNSVQPNRREWGTIVSATPTGAGTGLVDFGIDVSPAAPNNASAASIPSPMNFCPGTYPVKALIKNNGNNLISSLKVNWTLDGVAQPQINFNYPLDTVGGAGINDTLLTLGNVTFPPSVVRVVKVWTSLPNNVADTVNADDTALRAMRSALSGPYTVNGTTPDFPTLDSAASALNLYGVCGPVTMNVRSGTYTGQKASLNDISGASAVNTITFKPEANVSGAVTFSNNVTLAADNFIFKLNSTKFTTIKNLWFTPLNGTNARVLELTGGPTNDSFINCKSTLLPSILTGTAGAAVFGSPITGSNLIIQNDTFINGNIDIYLYGASTVALYNNCRIENNLFTNPGYMGTYLYYHDNLRLRGNTVNATGSQASTLYGLAAHYAQNGSMITDNVVNITATTATYPFRIYYNQATAAQPGLVENNRINCSTTTGINYGFYHYYCQYQTVKNNTSIATSTTGSNYALYSYYPTGCDYLNNSFHSNSLATTNYCYVYNSTNPNNTYYNNVFSKSASTGYAVYMYSPAYQTMDYNLFWQGTGTDILYAVTGASPTGAYTSLQAMRNATGSNLNSLVYRPPYTSFTSDLMPNPADTAAWALQGRGVHVAGNNKDITGAPRVTTRPSGVPDIGAWEFTPTSIPPIAIAVPVTPAAGTTQTFTFGQDTVETIAWAPASTVPSSIQVRAYSGTLPPPVFPTGDFMWFYNSIDAPVAGTYNYTANTYYDEPWRGTNLVEVALRLAKKDGPAPWFTYLAPTSSANITRNFINAPNLTTLNAFYTARGQQCVGGNPLPSVITTPPLVGVKCAGQTITLAADDPNNLAGMLYQWQFSPTGLPGTWANVTNGTGDTTTTYTSGLLSTTVYYRIVTRCANGGTDTPSLAYYVPVDNPLILTTTPATRCGPGTATVSATATPSATINWYNSPTGFGIVGIGSPFTTPVLTTTTTYYVAATNAPCESPRIPVTVTVLTPPAFAITADRTVCNGEIVNVAVITPTTNYDTVGWTPVTNLYTNAAATVPYTGLSSFSLWAKSITPGVNSWVATAYQAANNCVVKDTVNIFVQPSSAILTGLPDTICVGGTSLLQLISNGGPFAPGSITYQKSVTGVPASFTNVFGPTGNSSYLTNYMTGDTFYRAQVRNTAGTICYEPSTKISVTIPQVASVIGSSHCGPGPVTLLAYSSPGTTLRWYATATGGGQPLAIGGTFTTPIIFQTTTFYVGASTDNDTGTVGPLSPTAVGAANATGVNNTNYVQFDVLTNTTLKSVDIFPTSALNTPGSIVVLNNANNIVATVNYTTTVTNGNMQRVLLNVNLPAATGYRIRQGAGTASLTYNTAGATYPYTSSDIVITGNNQLPNYYLFFYNWKWLSGCESPRTPVVATITPSPAVSFTPPTYNICFGDTTTITAVSTNPGYQYEWPQLGVFGPVITVTPQVSTPYYLYSIDTSNGPFAGCTHYDTARVTVFPRPAADVIPTNTTTFCVGDSVKLIAITNPLYTYQWQINGANIPGATDTTITVYAPGNYFIRTLLGFCYQTSLPEQVIVNPLPQPTISSVNFVLNTESYDSYQWLKDGTIIYGATNQFYVPQGPGDYEVAVTDINGCTNTSSIFRVDPVGVPNVNGAGGIVRIKPNPVRDVLLIEAPVPVTAVITTIDGRLILRQANAKRVDMGNVADGVYMLRVLDKDGRNLKTEKLVKTSW